MAISFERIQIGENYDRPYLAELWGYKSWQAIGRGIVTPSGEQAIILFVTEDKQDHLPQYQDSLVDDRLHMEGERGHVNDRRLVEASASGDVIHLFHRARHHEPFRYHGVVELVDHELNQNGPSKFVLQLLNDEERALHDIRTERITHGDVDEELVPEEEGRRRIRTHVEYERSAKNRAAAIRIHGSACEVCGMDFDQVYGKDLARGYIEVHHLKSIASGERTVDPTEDLVPLCSNCHGMAHRRHREIVSVAELQERVRGSR